MPLAASTVVGVFVLLVLGAAPTPDGGLTVADAALPPAADGVPDGGDGGVLPEDADDEDEDEGDEDGDVDDGEVESAGEPPAPTGGPVYRYTADLSDEEVERLWRTDPAALGSISVGFADQGRMINAVQIKDGEGWVVVDPAAAWGVQETVDAVMVALRAVHQQFPESAPLRVNHISKKDGGYLRPHQSHQAGRDVDLAFYYRSDVPPGFRGRREHLIDPARNWALVRALATLTDVQVILVDRRIQKVLYDHALSIGEDKAWLDSIFRAGSKALVKHARRHRDHFHVRFYAPRAQELGRRIQPLLAQRPDQNLLVHRIRSGETLGHIARRYDTSVRAIMKANHMRRTFLRVGRTIVVPLRGPCTHCPLPPEVVVPPRRLPPPRLDGGAAAPSPPDAAVESAPRDAAVDLAAPDGAREMTAPDGGPDAATPDDAGAPPDAGPGENAGTLPDDAGGANNGDPLESG
ncbi:MAG: penicillin-insensitive murein endopeptidase [Myxococcota bacterium]